MMNRHNEPNPSPPNGVAKGMAELTRDTVSLAELQFELFRIDCRDGFKRLVVPVALLLFAGIVAVGAVPIVLLLIAELLAQAAGLSRWAALSIAALSGLVVAASIGLAGWSYLRGTVRVFERSREEWARNLSWIKRAFKRPAPIESEKLPVG